MVLRVDENDSCSQIDKSKLYDLASGDYIVSIDSDVVFINPPKFIETLKKEKPDTIKGEFIKSIFITSTMGVSYKVIGK